MLIQYGKATSGRVVRPGGVITYPRGGDPYAVNGLSPAFVADFVTGYYRAGGVDTDFASLFTFSRQAERVLLPVTPGEATYVDAQGVLQSVPDNVPRLGHHVFENGQWVNKGILIEADQGTNYIRDSEDLTSSLWSGVVTSVATDGTKLMGRDAYKVTCPSGGTSFYVNAGTVSGVDVVNLSCYLKRGNFDFESDFYLAIYDVTTGAVVGQVQFNFATGVTTYFTGTVTQHGSAEVEGGWFVYITTPWTPGNSLRGYIGGLGGSIPNGEYYVTAPQMEGNFVPSSYIPTAGVSQARAGETLRINTMPASQPAFSFYHRCASSHWDGDMFGQVPYASWFADATNKVDWRLDTDGDNVGLFRLRQDTTATPNQTISALGTQRDPGLYVPVSYASRHTASAMAVKVEGDILRTFAGTADLPDLSAGYLNLAALRMAGPHAEVRLWTDDIGDEGLEALIDG